jgi:hypothetical protein
VNITPEGREMMIDFGNLAAAHCYLIGVNAAAINATDFILAPRGGHHSKANAQYHGTGRLDAP